MRALIVDDDDVSRLIAAESLSGDPEIEVVTASSSQEALDHLMQDESFDCLLLDWSMPEKSGLELLSELRGDARFRDLQVIMLTVENTIEYVKRALDAGANEYLMKPFTPAMLRSKLALLNFK